jgi:hypothetical protein
MWLYKHLINTKIKKEEKCHKEHMESTENN